MGRYATFSTGLDIKFAFGIQPSQDICEFGGLTDVINGIHYWKEEDRATCLERVLSIQEEHGITYLPDWNSYELSLAGTKKMRDDVYTHVLDIQPPGFQNGPYYLYLLGCTIYHQLLYEPTLKADFEW